MKSWSFIRKMKSTRLSYKRGTNDKKEFPLHGGEQEFPLRGGEDEKFPLRDGEEEKFPLCGGEEEIFEMHCPGRRFPL